MTFKSVFNALKPHLVANGTAAAIIGITKFANLQDGGILAFSEFVIVPMLMGIICAWFWRDLNYSTGEILSRCIITLLFSLIMSFFMFEEGVLCLIIVSPLLFLFVTTGAFVGRAMFRRDDQNLNISIIGLLLIVFVVDSMSKHSYQNLVTDEIIVNAPPSEVWKHVVAYERNNSPNKYWFFKIGLPSPVQSTAEGYYKGAKRKCIFSNGYTFDEVITEYDANRKLTFDVTNQPRDPEIMGHLDLVRGQFILKDNGNNTTTLIGNSWYRLYVFPTWYYDMWTKSVVRNVHLRVMDHIKYLSERPALSQN